MGSVSKERQYSEGKSGCGKVFLPWRRVDERHGPVEKKASS